MARSLTPSQMDVLRALGQTPGVTPEAVAAATALPVGGVNWNLDVLDERGLVEFELINDAGEVNALFRLTPRGEDLLKKMDQ